LKLDAVTTQHVQGLKSELSNLSPKSVNNALTVLGTLLNTAVEWKVIDKMPCTIRLLSVMKPKVGFHDFEAYERLVSIAEQQSWQTHLLVLLGGDAGLRCGEMMALQRSDIDHEKRQICVQRSEWKGHVTPPKGGRLRYVPMTKRLAAALQKHRHLRSDRVVCADDGGSLTQRLVQGFVNRAARAAKVPEGVHILRHTFCSHLAMRGAAPTAIQAVAGHQDLSTTQRYLHLTPSAIESAIRLLEQDEGSGDSVETVGA
jgi:integrase